jgi:predicted phage-related endonuclease
MIERHRIDQSTAEGREAWLALRKRDVTASTVGALFSVHPYETPYGLYAQKCGLELPDQDDAVLRRGRWFEGAVAVAVSELRPEWRIEKATEYLRDPDLRLGATPDFYIHGDPRGLGVLQAKTAAPTVFKRDWQDGMPPFWISLQNATELMLETKAAFGVVAVVVVDSYRPDCQLFEIPRHAGAAKRITDAVKKFWQGVEAGIEPPLDYARDGDWIAAMYPAHIEDKTIDLSGDNALPVILPELVAIQARMKADKERADEIKNEIMAKMGDSEIALVGDFLVTCKTQHRKAYQVKESISRPVRVKDNRPKQFAEE